MSEGRSSPAECREPKDSDSAERLLPEGGTVTVVGCLSIRSDRAKYIMVAILTFVNMINYMDRFTLAGVLSKIQTYFDIGDEKGGLLQTVFIISYMIFAPLFGYLGDRYSRVKLMAAGVFLWSITTLIGSFMTTFGWFIFFRALVGIGEASYSTIAPTIISDLFVKEARSKVLAMFYFAIPVGSGLGYIVGSGMTDLMKGWQWALRVTPALGAVAVILILLFVYDPERGAAEGGNHISTTTYTEDLKSIMKNRSFLFTTFGFTCVAFVAGALSWWGPHFIHLGLKLQPGSADVSFNEVALIFGAITVLSGVIGVPIGVYLSNTLRKIYPSADPVICAFGLAVSSGVIAVAFWAIEFYSWSPFVLMFFGTLALNLNWVIVADMLLYVVIPTRRSTAEAFQILISHLFGDAGSPFLIGLISESLKKALSTAAGYSSVNSNNTVAFSVSMDTDRIKFVSLQRALFITTFVELLGAVFFLAAAAYIVRDKEKVDKHITESSNQPHNSYADDVSTSTNVPC